MSNPTFKLASDFPQAHHQDWVSLVEKTLRGKDFDSVMQKHSYDCIAIDALYTAESARIEPQNGITKAGWDICQSYWGADVKEANAAFLSDLERGASSIALRIASGGFSGLPVDAMDAVLEGVYLNMCSVQLIADEEFDAAGRAYLDLLDHRDIASTEASGSLGADPIGTLALTGRLLTSLEASIASAAMLAKETAALYPGISTFNVAGLNYHSAGATEAQELGACLSIGVQYLRAMEEIGIDLDTAASQIEFTLAADADIFMTVAKFRAFRRLWAQVLASSHVKNTNCRVTAVTAVRMMSARDPWVNILRGTTACFAAGIAGADCISVLPHDTMLGLPTGFSRRIARNIQIILQEESYLTQVADPAAGSYAFESITADLAAKAWQEFQSLEGRGGFSSCLLSGEVPRKLCEIWALRKSKIDTREEAITGVSEFPNIHEDIPETAAMPSFVEDVQPAGEILDPIKMHRSAEDYEALRSYSDTLLAKNGKRPSIFLANMGTVSQHTARAMFAKNFFEAGGIAAIGNDGFDSDEAMISTFKDSGADMAVLCGLDAHYEDRGEVVVTGLKDAGCHQVYVAGRPENAKALTGSGVNDFIFKGADVLSALQTAMTELGDK